MDDDTDDEDEDEGSYNYDPLKVFLLLIGIAVEIL